MEEPRLWFANNPKTSKAYAWQAFVEGLRDSTVVQLVQLRKDLADENELISRKSAYAAQLLDLLLY